MCEDGLTEVAVAISARGEAYRRIPHQRTPFRTDLSNMRDDEASYLLKMFRLTDAAVVERVYQQSQLQAGELSSLQDNSYAELMQRLGALPTPEKLLPVEALIFEALEEQHRYFKDWGESGNTGYFTSYASLVESSHKKLIAAYNELMRLYAQESAHNRQTFFDHLCALDFI